MSLYNMINGTTPFTFIVLPLLGKHPEEYPRFRDCFLIDKEHPEYNNKIQVYTRVGGGNREDYKKEIKELQNMKGYIDDFDDDFDNTYSTFVFEIPEKWRNDIKLITEEGKIKETSKEYQKFIIDFWKEKSNTKDFYKKIENLFKNKQ